MKFASPVSVPSHAVAENCQQPEPLTEHRRGLPAGTTSEGRTRLGARLSDAVPCMAASGGLTTWWFLAPWPLEASTIQLLTALFPRTAPLYEWGFLAGWMAAPGLLAWMGIRVARAMATRLPSWWLQKVNPWRQKPVLQGPYVDVVVPAMNLPPRPQPPSEAPLSGQGPAPSHHTQHGVPMWH